MKRTRHTPEQIFRKLKTADQLIAQGKTVADVCRVLEVAQPTYHRWLSRVNQVDWRIAPGPMKGVTSLQQRPQLAEATNVIGEVQSRSPGFRPKARKAMCSALVALFTATSLSAHMCLQRLLEGRHCRPYVRKVCGALLILVQKTDPRDHGSAHATVP